eukprot:gene5509-6863_t
MSTSTTDTATHKQPAPIIPSLSLLVHYFSIEDNEDQVTRINFENVTDYDSLLPKIKETMGLETPVPRISLFSHSSNNNNNRIKYSPLDPINATISEIYVETPQPPGQKRLKILELKQLCNDTLSIHPFVNRTNEIKSMAEIFSKVVKLREIGATDINMVIPLVITCQMWGSGKTALGANFLHEIKKYDDKEKLKYDPRLFNLDYIYIDTRSFVGKVERDSHPLSVLVHSFQYALIKKASPGISVPTSSSELESIFMDHCVNQFRKYLFHIDELEAWFRSIYEKEPKETIEILSSLWNLVFHPMILYGNPVYVSGRTSLLFSIGRNLYREKWGIVSPNRNEICWILLHILEKSHIEEILKQYGFTDSFQNKKHAEEIFTLTGGIPRLVVGSIEYITNEKPNELNSTCLRQYLNKSLSHQLLPIHDIPNKNLYFELMRVSILNPPVKLSQKLPKSSFISYPMEIKHQLLYADLIQFYYIYIDTYKDDAYLIFPKLLVEQLREIISDEQTKNRLVFFSNEIFESNLVQTGIPFENCFKISVLSRMISGLEPTTVNKFEILKNSWAEGYDFSNDPDKVFRNFPIIVNEEQQFNNFDQVVEYINSQNPSCPPKFNNRKFGSLWKVAKKYVLYRSGVGWILKGGKERAKGINYIINEITKSAPDTNIKMVCVLVALKINQSIQYGGYDETIPNNRKFFPTIVEFHDNEIGYFFKSGSTIQKSDGDKFKIPSHVQLIVLQPKGVEYLFGSIVYDLLLNFVDKNIEPCLINKNNNEDASTEVVEIDVDVE